MVLFWISKQRQIKLAVNYYIILVTVYLLSVYFPIIRSGVTMSIVLLMLIWSLKIKSGGTEIQNLVTLFFIYSVLSIIGYFYNEIPFSAYWGDLTNQCFPIVFFFIAYSNYSIKERFYKKTTIAIAAALIVGLYFYFANPQVYLDFMVRTSDSTYIGKVGTIQRFNSLFGSTATGSLSVFLIIFSIYFFYNQKTRNKKSLNYIFLYILGLVCAQLTSQRSAMVMSIAIVLLFYFCGFIKSRKIERAFTLINVLLAIGIFYIFIALFQDYFDLIFERFDSLGEEGYGGRSNQWIENFSHHPNILFGSGLGSVGHKAAGFAKYPIYDGGLFKYISELGIIGFLIFLFIIIRATFYKFKYIVELWREYAIIFVCILQSTGSNTLSMQVVLPLFWFSIGIISSYKKENGNHSILSSAIPSYSRQ